MSYNISIQSLLRKPAYSASLAVFRMVFGLMLAAGVLRFWLNGWIEALYIEPKHFFYYYGFEWVRPLGIWTYGLFALCGLSALGFALGYRYRLSAVLLFLSFTYIELMDKTNYLNHYYFVSLMLFLMIWLPAQLSLSIDARRRPELQRRFVPLWTIGVLRLMLALVYCYAGLAKLNSDWLLQAMPLRLWLPANNDLPLVGPLLNQLWVAYAFSWFGALYDLTIPFFLLHSKTRPYAFIAVVVFHVATSVLFPIGMFPYIMILSALIFFPSAMADRLAQRISHYLTWLPAAGGAQIFNFAARKRRLLLGLFTVFFVLQILLPWRYLLTPGTLFWTEAGYRFSWRVMLMEKLGYAQFVVEDAVTGQRIAVNNNDFLTKNQEKMMATQPDFILQFAQILKRHYEQQGLHEPRVYGQIYVTLNGRRSRPYIDSSVDLARETDSFQPKKWILAFQDRIYGL